ncbi:contact-dependent growth inhibition system immunity protein, partial [Streptomyces sp. NPDC052127]|uniref:contact-dependent growth inhibition system immunity protein n=1 Tax=Streptomyces sp. NPDC052127 TaxID=3155679 RepID=UPI003449FAEC
MRPGDGTGLSASTSSSVSFGLACPVSAGRRTECPVSDDLRPRLRENRLVTVSVDRSRSLEELERDRWQAPPPDATRLISRVHALRSRPVGSLTVEDLRLLIRQDIGLAVLLPLAVEVLRDNPLAE